MQLAMPSGKWPMTLHQNYKTNSTTRYVHVQCFNFLSIDDDKWNMFLEEFSVQLMVLNLIN